MNAERPELYLQQKDEDREDTKEGIRIRIRRRTNYSIATTITTKRQTIIYQALYIQLMIKQQEPH
jgi:hypothetical protein